MDIPSFLASPVGAVIASLATTVAGELFGSWLSHRQDTPTPAITVQDRARVGQINIGHRWQSEVHHHHHAPTAASPSTDADAGDQMWVLLIGVLVVGCVGAVAMARYWPIFELVVQGVVLVALFTTAILRRRWPSGLAATVGMRLLIFAIGAALLWATTVIPGGVPGVHDLAYVHRHTRRLDFMDAVSRAPHVLGIDGVFLYLYRLLGLAGLIMQLVFLTAKAWGAALLADAPGTSFGRGRAWLGEKLTGAIPFDWGAAVMNLVLASTWIAVIHPTSVSWLISVRTIVK